MHRLLFINLQSLRIASLNELLLKVMSCLLVLEILNTINCLYLLDLLVSTQTYSYAGSPSCPLLKQMHTMLAKLRVMWYTALWRSLIIALMAVLSKPDKVVPIVSGVCHQMIQLLHLSITS